MQIFYCIVDHNSTVSLYVSNDESLMCCIILYMSYVPACHCVLHLVAIDFVVSYMENMLSF